MSKVTNPRFADWEDGVDFFKLCSAEELDVNTILKEIKAKPILAKSCNMAGRTPLHYCLGRGDPNSNLILTLLKLSPESIFIEDFRGTLSYHTS